MSVRSVRFFLPILASACLTIAIFPRLEIWWLAFVCLLPVLILVPSYGIRRLSGVYFCAGFLFRVGNLYWIYHVIRHYTSLNPLLCVGLLILLCLALALYWAAFGASLSLLNRGIGLKGALLVAPFVWILLEKMHDWIQFPWCLLGYSLYQQLSLAQGASLFGVYGLSALLVGVNAALALLLLRRDYYYICSMIVILGAFWIYGNRMIHRPLEGPKVRVGVIQGNIPQDVKINFDFAEQVNRIHINMTRELIREVKPDIIFWPESATLYQLKSGGPWAEEVLALARDSSTPLLLGSDSVAGDKIYNTAFLINSHGMIQPMDYSKMYLVPFGEFVPLKSFLFFAGKVVPEISDFSPGEKYTQFPVNGGFFSVHICFEVIFPHLTRVFVRGGTNLLATITNDAWFGRSSAPYQHFAMAIMRSIESRRYLVRAANTGISGIVDPYGRILKKTDIFVPAKFAGEVQILREVTFYSRHGDILIYVALVVVAIALGASLRRRPVQVSSGNS